MPPPKKRATLDPTPDANWTREVPLNYTSFKVPPMINAKNVTATYLKTDAQTWIARAASQIGLSGPQKDAAGAPKKRKKGKSTVAAAAESEEEEEDEDEEEGKMAASNTIVIHPGSHTLRIGRATDLSPLSYPFVLARRAARTLNASNEAHMPTDNPESAEQQAERNDKPSAAEPGAAPSQAAVRANGDGSTAKPDEEEDEEDEEATSDTLSPKIEVLRQDLRVIMRSMKLRPVSNGRQLAMGYNETAEPERVPDHSDVYSFEWTQPSANEEILIGDQALRMACFSIAEGDKDMNASSSRPWKLFRPFKRGMLNVDEYVEHYGTTSADSVLLGDFQKFLEMVLEAPELKDVADEHTGLTGLGIPRSEWSSLNIVLVVPDLLSRFHVRTLTHLFLSTMGFAGICLQSEGVAATFGAGLSSACVVDLGAETINISCVEDGLVVPESRIELCFGGNDISTFFAELLHRGKVPYTALNINKRIVDLQIIEDIKERALTLHPSDIGLNFWDFQVRLPNKLTDKYKFRMYDEPIVGPLMLFAPRVVDFDAKKGPRTPRRTLSLAAKMAEDVEDPGEPAHEDISETVTMFKTIEHLIPHAMMQAQQAGEAPNRQAAVPDANGVRDSPTAAAVASGSNAGNTATGTSQPEGANMSNAVATAAAVTATAAAGAAGEGTGGAGTPAPGPPPAPASLTPAQLGIDVHWESSKTPLDVAVWASILGSTNVLIGIQSTEERIRRMSQNILCVGGSALIPGLAAALEARASVRSALLNHIVISFDQSQTLFISGNVPIATTIPPPRDMDPRIVCWKGSAVMSRLASAGDFLVRKQDWEMLNWRAVREKT
ncbi:actin-like ATPase domain-containing protein [Tilletiaria anomala UBC 951]|uniref:Actin-like ATPase domain-containing protein n=1 Tax=Tilletiaria anomala (strain ATCC 24038 / CBS 436.72 / UBC 951) TaxID=1037660 RepID=A0A066VTK1_TILAU|nr:actin-like ATPase domain-containing protein [Tilletiaria anomala UBC 951]KDN41865.1 actin-like ATPase domain-containing protein [Tilletiaria anomala UBC 951]